MEGTEFNGLAPKSVALFLQEDHRGQVLMVNASGIYVNLDGQILLLCDRKWGTVPNGILLSEFREIGERLSPGQQVRSEKDCLHFPAGWITIAKIEEGKTFRGKAPAPVNWQTARKALWGRETGLAPLAWDPERTALCTLAGPRVKKLLCSLREGNAAGIEEAVKALLGLGPGLTPSADDLLCGLTYGLLRSPLEGVSAVRAMQKAILDHAAARTHPVSAAYLRAIAEGETFSRLEDAWKFLTGEGPNTLEALLEIGSSSGGDLLLGLLLAGECAWTGISEGPKPCGTER